MTEAQAPRVADAHEGLPTARRRKAALALAAGLALAVLDSTMTNVALPSIAQDLKASDSAVVWVVNAYTLTVAMTLLPMSAIGERIGFKRLFYYGLWTFILASLGSALASSMPVLLGARIFQGLGGSAIMCLFGALVRNIYPPHLIGRGIGLNAMMLGVRYLPDVPRISASYDWFAAALSMTTIALLILGIDALSTNFLLAVVLLSASFVIGWALVRRSAQQTAPLVPVDLFRIPAMRFALAASASTFCAQMATMVSLPFYLQVTLNRPQMAVGVLMAGWPVGAALIAAIAGPLSDRFPVAILSGLGAAAMAIGLGLVVVMPTSASDAWLFTAMVLAGIGFGFFQTPNNRVMLGSAPRNRAGAVGGLQATTRVFSQTFGAAIVAVVFSLGFSSGPMLGLCVAIGFALIAVGVNTLRYFQAPRSRADG